MDEVIIEKQEYLLFDKYKLNTNRNITRYEYISNVPLKVSKREPDMRVCKCGAHLITLAYIFDNNIFRSRTLLGRKCPCCGHNYFTLKTIALCEEAFTIVEYTDLEENIGKEVQVDMYEVKRGDIKTKYELMDEEIFDSWLSIYHSVYDKCELEVERLESENSIAFERQMLKEYKDTIGNCMCFKEYEVASSGNSWRHLVLNFCIKKTVACIVSCSNFSADIFNNR